MDDKKNAKLPSGVYLRFPTQEAYDKFMNDENEPSPDAEEIDDSEPEMKMI